MELLEAANAILLSFQILSDALDNPPQPRDRRWETKRVARTMKYALNRYSNHFKEIIDSLLITPADEEDALAELCEDPRHEKWKDTDLAKAVRRKCGESYEQIQNTLEKMKSLLDNIQTGGGEIKLPPNGDNEVLDIISDDDATKAITNPQTSDPNAGADLFVSRECIEVKKQLLDQCGKYNEELEWLVCPDTTSVERQTRRPAIEKPIVTFWHHARKLHNFIRRSWHCKCHRLHQTNLLLQYRDNQKVEFNLLFLFGNSVTDTPQPWIWQDITLKPLEHQEEDRIVPPPASKEIPKDPLTPQMDPQPNRLKGFIHSKLKARKVTSWVRSKSRQEKTAILSSSPSLSAPLSPKRRVAFSGIDQPESHTNQKFDDLCETFKTHRSQQKWREVLSGGDTLYSLSQGLHFREQRCATREKKTLGNLLDSGHLNQSECCLVALVLASSVYQLHSSPWLQTSWDKGQIVFFSSFTDSSKILKDKPFLSGEHFHGTTHRSLPLASRPGDLVLESLGITLLELCFGKTLETFPKYKDMGQVKLSHSFSHGFAEKQLLPLAYNRMGPEFADAIAWCLTHRETSLENDRWRHELFDYVIIPLYKIYRKIPTIPDGTSMVNVGINHNGNISDGGVGNYGNIIFEGSGRNYIGGTHTHLYASKTLNERVS